MVLNRRDIIEKLGERGLDLIGEYTRIGDVHLLQCVEYGHEFRDCLSYIFYKNHGCPICGKRNYISTVEQAVWKLGGKGVQRYHAGGLMDNMTLPELKKACWLFQCGRGHTFEKSPDSVLKGGWCKDCRRIDKHLSKAKKYASERRMVCISDGPDLKRATPLEWQCIDCGYKWKRALYDIKRDGNGCPVCTGGNRHYNLEYFKKLAQEQNMECVSSRYNNVKSRLKFKCDRCGYVSNIVAGKIVHIYKGTINCRRCQSSPLENRCRYYLESIFGKPFPIVRPDWLKNPKTGKNLELDGYCEDFGIAFEFQGSHHYTVVEFQNGVSDIDYQKYKDEIKLKLCGEHGVVLIVIPHMEKSNLLQFTINECKKRGLLKTKFDGGMG